MKSFAGKVVLFFVAFTPYVLFPCRAVGREGDYSPRYEFFSLSNISVLTVDSRHEPPAGQWGPFHRLMPESREIFHAILPWNWQSRRAALGIGAITLPLLLSKNEIQEHVDLCEGDEIHFVSSDAFYTRFEFLGNRWTLPAISGAFVLGGIIGRRPRELETGLMIAQSVFFTAAATGLGQFVLSEE